MNRRIWIFLSLLLIAAAIVMFFIYRPHFREDARMEKSLELYNSGFQDYFQNDIKKAEGNFRESVRLNPEELDFRIALSEILYKRGKTEEALKEISGVQQPEGDGIQSLAYLKTRLLLSMGRYNEAVSLCRQDALSNQGDETSFNILADSLIRKYYMDVQRTGEKDAAILEEAVSSIRRSIRLDPLEYYSFLQMGLVEFLENRIVSAEKYLLKAEELEKKAFQGYSMNIHYNTLKNPAMDHRPEDMNDSVNMHILKGFCALSRGDTRIFNQCLSSALDNLKNWTIPQYSQAYPKQELIMMARDIFSGRTTRLQNLESLEPYYQRLDSCSIVSPPGAVQMRKLMLDLVRSKEKGDLGEAGKQAENIKKLLLEDPLPTSGCAFHAIFIPLMDITLSTYLGDAYRDKNQPDDAGKYYEKALLLQPWNAVIKSKLAALKTQ